MGCGQGWSSHLLTLRDDHTYTDKRDWGGTHGAGSEESSGTWLISLSTDGTCLELSGGGSYDLENFSPDSYYSRGHWSKVEGG